MGAQTLRLLYWLSPVFDGVWFVVGRINIGG